MPKLKRTTSGPEIDMSGFDWAGLLEFDDLAGTTIPDFIAKATTEAVKQCFDESPAYVSLPSILCKTVVPLTLYVELPLGRHSDELVLWTIPFRDVVWDILESHQHGDGMVKDAEGKSIILSIATGLREIADAIEAKVEV